MNDRNCLACLLALFVAATGASYGRLAPPGVVIITTFDYPGTGNSTYPFHISNSGDTAGYFVDPSGPRADSYGYAMAL